MASLDGDEESLQRRWRPRQRGARAGAQPGREAGEALAPLTSVFLFRALFISPPPAALLPERALRAGVSRPLPPEGPRHPAPRTAARRHREGRGPGRRRDPRQGWRRARAASSPRIRGYFPRPLPGQSNLGPGLGAGRLSRPALGQAQPGAQCKRAAPRVPTSAALEAQAARKLLLQRPALFRCV